MKQSILVLALCIVPQVLIGQTSNAPRMDNGEIVEIDSIRVDDNQSWKGFYTGTGSQKTCSVYTRPIQVDVEEAIVSAEADNIPEGLEDLDLRGTGGFIEYNEDLVAEIKDLIEEGRKVRGGGVWSAVLNREVQNQNRTLEAPFDQRRTYDYFSDDLPELVNSVNRGEMVMFITWYSQNVTSQTGTVSILAGADVEQGLAGHGIAIGNTRYHLYGHQDRLYVQDQDEDAVLSALRAGTQAQVDTVFDNGLVVQDTYSLMGLVATTRTLSDVCS